jgi:hypothetical protein
MTFWQYVIDFLLHLWRFFTILSVLGIFWIALSIVLYRPKNNPSWPFVESYHIEFLCVDAVLIINYMIAGLLGFNVGQYKAFFKEGIEDLTPLFAPLFVIGIICFVIKLIMTIILYNKKCKEFSLSHKKGKIDSSYN